MKRTIGFLLLLVTALLPVVAQQVTWSYRLIGDNTATPSIEITATIAPGFHLYAPNTPPGGPEPLVFYFDTKGCTLDGKPVANKAYTKEYDDVFEVDQYFYSNSVKFTQKLKAAAKEWQGTRRGEGSGLRRHGMLPGERLTPPSRGRRR